MSLVARSLLPYRCIPRAYSSAATATVASNATPAPPAANKEKQIEAFFNTFAEERQRLEINRREAIHDLQKSLQSAASAQQGAAQMPEASSLTRVRWRRKFFPGDTYEPEDLARDQVRREIPLGSHLAGGPNGDILESSGIDVDREYKNIALLSSFTNNIGQVLSTRKTGLSRQSQSRVVRAINRAVAFGIIPKTRKHWKLLQSRD